MVESSDEQIQIVFKLARAVATNTRPVWSLRAFARDSRFDLIISFGDKTNVLLLLATLGIRVPIIVAEHNDPRKQFIGAAAGYLRRLLYQRASAVVVLTPGIKEWARQIVASELIRVIPNPISDQFIRGAPSIVKGQGHFAVAMGRMSFEKGFDLLLNAFAICVRNYPDWKLRLVGQGVEEQQLRNLAAQLGIQNAVRFEPVTREPETILRECDLFVLSSRTEGFPMVLLAATVFRNRAPKGIKGRGCGSEHRRYFPVSPVVKHGIENNQKLTHAGDEGRLGVLTIGAQPQIESFDNGIAANSRHRCHIQDAPDLGASAPDTTAAAQASAVAVKGR